MSQEQLLSVADLSTLYFRNMALSISTYKHLTDHLKPDILRSFKNWDQFYSQFYLFGDMEKNMNNSSHLTFT